MSSETLAVPEPYWPSDQESWDETTEEIEWEGFNRNRQLRAYNMHLAQPETNYNYRSRRVAQEEINLYHRENRQKHFIVYTLPNK